MRFPWQGKAPPKFCTKCGCATITDYTSVNLYGGVESDYFDPETGEGVRTRLELIRCPKYGKGDWYPNYHTAHYTGKKIVSTIPNECGDVVLEP